jgi:SNF2 family DNA or RNA helicase
MADPGGFIVDNTDDEWKALEYVREWCDLSESIDIATGHFEIGAFFALDGQWQKVDRVRLLIGGETSRMTADAIAAALDRSIRVERQKDDAFLTGVEAVVDAIRRGKVEIRTYSRKKFHAKAYITHGRHKVVGSAALVGSSNFTRPGLTQNVELNVKFQGPEVRELQQWYDDHWDEAEPVTPELLKVLEHNVREFTPFEVYLKALHALTRDLEAPDVSWERDSSVIFSLLAPYQREAYYALRRMADERRGGFLTDGVGLGKTFVGLMLTEYYAARKRKNVLIMATKTGQDAVWLPELRARLPHLSGEFTNVRVMAHTDLSRANAPEVIAQLRDRVDVVIIDEAHNFRNHGPKGEEEDTRRSRWWRMQEICKGKTVFLLTATPINNTLFDLVHQIELFSDMRDDYFDGLGVSSLQRYAANLEKPFRDAAKQGIGATIDLTDFDKLMQQDKLLEAVIHQSSRKYAVESSKVDAEETVHFPEQQVPRAVPYSLGLHYGHLLDELEKAFQKNSPLFVLPMYYPLAYSTREDVDTVAENRQKQVVGLIRTTFLKRFESSVAAFAGSCLDLSLKITRWLDVNTRDHPVHQRHLKSWLGRKQKLLDDVHQHYRPTLEMGDSSVDLTEEEFDELEENLGGGEYDFEAMFKDAFEDLTQLGRFLERIADATGVDDKYERLRDLLIPSTTKAKSVDKVVFTPEFRHQKVIVFSEYADTARHLHERLAADGLADLDRLDGTRSTDRFAMIKRFAPHYNKVDAGQRKKQSALRVLVSTDVLSEGVNLQDANLLVNYDLHWNPVRLMQRIGRVDRRLDPVIEKAIVTEHPSLKGSRGKVQVRNFLPPDDLETLLRLHERIASKTLLISKTLGIPGGKLLTEDEMLDDVKVFQAFREEMEGELAPIEELRLAYQQLLKDDPRLADRIDRLPDGIHAAKSGDPKGLFLCRRMPVLRQGQEGEDDTWTMHPGRIEWSLSTAGDGDPLRGLARIDGAVRSTDHTPGVVVSDKPAVLRALRAAESSDTKRYRKELRLPLDAPPPETLCWMEVR